ncbi:MAG: acyl carrier protein [Bdellovibrio sp.]
MMFSTAEISRLIEGVGLNPKRRPLNESTDLFDDGFLDSISVIQLVTKCEEVFDITFDFKDLTKANFLSVATLTALLRDKYKVAFGENSDV